MQVNRDAFYIGGRWVAPASDRRFELIGAATGASLGRVPEATEADVDRAVAAARDAFENSSWADTAPAERADVIRRFAAAIDKRRSAIAQAVSAQNGMPLSLSEMAEAQVYSVHLLNYYADLAASAGRMERRPSQMGRETLVGGTPIGVVAGIVPWNFPVTLAINKIGPALAAGCTLVLKPSPGTVLDSYLLAEAAEEAQVPPGVLNWVAADRDVGAYLVSHPGVDKVAFTGSTAAGRNIGRVCGEMLRPVTLELGGKSAAVVLDDANLDVLVRNLPMAALLNNGQACMNSTRILVPTSRYDAVLEALVSMVRSFKIGDPLDPTTTMGPMASAAHRDRVEGYIARGKTEARLLVGGGRPLGLDRGWFVEPTVFVDVPNSAVIAQEEIFGPVLCVIPYRDEADAVRIANDSPYGLAGTVWSGDADRAQRVAQRMKTGSVGINGYLPSIGSPFGGVKASGLGREFGPEALAAYQNLKSIYVMQ